jgi:hypothetical protein
MTRRRDDDRRRSNDVARIASDVHARELIGITDDDEPSTWSQSLEHLAIIGNGTIDVSSSTTTSYGSGLSASNSNRVLTAGSGPRRRCRVSAGIIPQLTGHRRRCDGATQPVSAA